MDRGELSLSLVHLPLKVLYAEAGTYLFPGAYEPP